MVQLAKLYQRNNISNKKNMETFLTQLISGAIGGNAAVATNKKQDLGPVWNTIIGIIGGIAGSELLQNFISNMINNSFGNVLGSAACGAIAVYIVNFIKNFLQKNKNNQTQ